MKRSPIKNRRVKPRPGRLTPAEMTKLRTEVFERDGYRCQHIIGHTLVHGRPHPCGKLVTWDSGHLAHVISRGRGGPDTAENCVTKCPHCHLVLEHNPKSVPAKERTL